MNRREFLGGMGVVTAAGISGCLGSEDELATEGNDDEPLEADPEALLLTAEQMEAEKEESWESETAIDDDTLMFTDAHLVRGLVPEEDDNVMESEYTTMSGVWVYETVEAARERYEESPFQHGHGYEEEEIAVESISGIFEEGGLGAPDWGHVLFRDANVLAAVAYHPGTVDPEDLTRTALELAAAKHERWRE